MLFIISFCYLRAFRDLCFGCAACSALRWAVVWFICRMMETVFRPWTDDISFLCWAIPSPRLGLQEELFPILPDFLLFPTSTDRTSSHDQAPALAYSNFMYFTYFTSISLACYKTMVGEQHKQRTWTNTDTWDTLWEPQLLQILWDHGWILKF